MFLIEGMAERKSSRLPPGPPRQNREDLPTLVVAPRINIERNRAYLALLDDGHRDLTELRRTYGQLEERQLNQDRMNNKSPSISDIDDSPVRTINPFPMVIGGSSSSDIPDIDQRVENVNNDSRVSNLPSPVSRSRIPNARSISPPILHFRFPTVRSSRSQNFNSN